MKLTVRTKDKRYNIEADPSTTILDLKKQIESVIPDSVSSSMRLIHAGKFLNDDKKTISDFSIPEEAVIYVTIQQAARKPVDAGRQHVEEPLDMGQGPNQSGIRELMISQLNQMLENPSMIDLMFGSQMVGRSEAEKVNMRETIMEQIRAMKNNPEMVDTMLEQISAMDPNMMQNLMKANTAGDAFKQAGMFPQPGTVPSSGLNQNLNQNFNNLNNLNSQQMFNTQYPQPSPSVPCTHGYYPYGYVGPQVMPQQTQQTQQTMYQAPSQDYATQFSAQLEALEGMGFADRNANLRALVASGGDIEMAIDLLLNSKKENK